MKKITAVKLSEKVFYGVGNLGYGVVAQTYGNFIMFFGTVVLGIPGTLMGIAIAVSMMWDAITDPLIGYLSDKQQNKFFGKRHGFMLIGVVGMAIFNIFIWSVPSYLNTTSKFVWLLISMLALETFNTMFATPYTALGAEMSDDYNERTNIQAYKTVFFLFGLLAPSVLMYLFLRTNDTNPQNYINMSIVTSIMVLAFGILSIIGTYSLLPRLKKKAELSRADTKERTPRQIFKMFFFSLRKKNYSSLVWGYAVSLISSAFITGVGLHLFKFGFYFSTIQISALMLILFVGTIISQPVWIKISKKHEKRPALQKGLLISFLGVIIIATTFIFRNDISATLRFILTAVGIFTSGFGTGAMYSLPISMLADLVTLEYAKTNKEKTGIYSGFMTLAYKGANAFALLVIGILLDVIKFNSKETTQTMSVQNGLGAIAIVGILVALVVSYIIYQHYNVRRTQVDKANKRIEKNHKKVNAENKKNGKLNAKTS